MYKYIIFFDKNLMYCFMESVINNSDFNCIILNVNEIVLVSSWIIYIFYNIDWM